MGAPSGARWGDGRIGYAGYRGGRRDRAALGGRGRPAACGGGDRAAVAQPADRFGQARSVVAAGDRGSVLGLGQGVPLLWRRGRPVLVVVSVGAAWLIAYLFVTGAAPFGLWVALYSLIVYATRRTAEVGGGGRRRVRGLGIVRVYAGGSARLQGACPCSSARCWWFVGFVVADRRTRSAALRDRASSSSGSARRCRVRLPPRSGCASRASSTTSWRTA